MATYSNTVIGGGTATSTGGTIFTTGAGQYAVVTATGSSPGTAWLVIGGANISGIIGTNPPIQAYVPPNTSVSNSSGGSSTGTYVWTIFG